MTTNGGFHPSSPHDRAPHVLDKLARNEDPRSPARPAGPWSTTPSSAPSAA
ncbi:hypothetical protein LT493_20990 [Streptomyces tricolor]|nr:hypothetical protein [Streptomyces tricolor]